MWGRRKSPEEREEAVREALTEYQADPGQGRAKVEKALSDYMGRDFKKIPLDDRIALEDLLNNPPRADD